MFYVILEFLILHTERKDVYFTTVIDRETKMTADNVLIKASLFRKILSRAVMLYYFYVTGQQTKMYNLLPVYTCAHIPNVHL